MELVQTTPELQLRCSVVGQSSPWVVMLGERDWLPTPHAALQIDQVPQV